ncbi:cytochrome P450 [Bisporella sp. PMI_857]|nr:cytochrome P450 [Bisporella sp. PMI_857]
MEVDIHNSPSQAVAFGTGLLLHVAAYRRGEWDLEIPTVSTVYSLLEIGAIYLLHNFSQNHEPLVSTVRGVAWLGVCHVLGIYTSMTIYRLFFHRLRHFPGPRLAPISNFYHTYLTAKKLHLYEEVEALHEQYGDFVRIGPSELSIADPSAIDAIYSAKSPCTKGPWYNILQPLVSLQMIRDKKEHARRRKVWDRGFGARALKDYEPRVAKYTEELLAQIQATSGKPLNVTDWFNFYSFDVMGDLAFGKSFNMLKDGVKHYFLKSLHADMTNIGYLSHTLWLFPFLKTTPILNAEHLKFKKWVETQVKERREMKLSKPDIFSWLLEEHNSRPETAETKRNLEADAHLIVVAGSDTTAATLTALFYELARSPASLAALSKELDEFFGAAEKADHISLGKLRYLDAVINETLRLHPAVPSGLQRLTPPDGLVIGGRFVPGNSIVQVPTHTVFRDERCFLKPTEFIPERWTTQPELTKNGAVLTPFSTGTYSCIGKQLALMELRYVVSQIVYRFDVALAPYQTEQAFLDGKRDTFTLVLGQLDLVFSDRK